MSVSHNGAFLMLMVGHGDQGCDVESIQSRDSMGGWPF